MKQKRVSTQIHTRKMDRHVAHVKMKMAGLVRVNDHKHGPSFFSEHWREAQYVNIK